ncbi:MAG: hypothetical protein U0V75_08460 [Ferruginibacter sp.]
MKTLSLTCFFLMTCAVFFAQNDISKLTEPIVEEGKKLYQSEMASWYGTDIFLEKYSNHDNTGGYISYTENGAYKCVFFSKGDHPKVLGTMIFDSTYNVETANTSLEERALTATENELRTLRQKAQAIIRNDTFFLSYNNSSLNIIPMIAGKEKKVYVLTGPIKPGLFYLGTITCFNLMTVTSCFQRKDCTTILSL